MTDSWIYHGVRIARTEWTRHHREFDGPWLGWRVLSLLLLAIAVVLGTVAHSVGRDLASGQTTTLGGLRIAASVAFVLLVWRSATVTRTQFERLNPDFLLTTVPARTAALGLLVIVYARLSAWLAIPTVGVALGTALGTRSPLVALTIVTAIAGMAALAVALGVAGGLTAQFVGVRMVRGNGYRDLLVVFGWAPLIAGAIVLQHYAESLAHLFGWLEIQPVAWFVDLALLGADDQWGIVGAVETSIELGRGLGALGGVVLSVPLLAGVTTVLTRRIWETEPASSTGPHGSHSLVGAGWLERLLGERVPRPVLTIARKRLLAERRVRRGILTTAYVFVFVALVVFPVVGLAGAPVLVLIVFTLGLAAGVAFAGDPIASNYRTVPMLFTTIDGREFVGGHVLAALIVGVPVVTVVVLPLGLMSPASGVETVVLVLVGVALCACTASVAAAVGMGVEYSVLVPVPFFFTDVPVYGEVGTGSFLRLAKLFAAGSLVTLPAFLGNVPSVYEAVAGLGIPAVAVRSGFLFLTILLATLVAKIAYRIAAQRYHDYQLG